MMKPSGRTFFRRVLFRQDLQFADEERAVAAVAETVVAVGHAETVRSCAELDFGEVVPGGHIGCDLPFGGEVAVDLDRDLGIDSLVGIADGIDMHDMDSGLRRFEVRFQFDEGVVDK